MGLQTKAKRAKVGASVGAKLYIVLATPVELCINVSRYHLTYPCFWGAEGTFRLVYALVQKGGGAPREQGLWGMGADGRYWNGIGRMDVASGMQYVQYSMYLS